MIAHTTRDFLPVADLLPYVEAVLSVYNTLGRRDNKYKARIKITVHETGAAEMTRLIEDRFAELRPLFEGHDQNLLDDIRAAFAPPGFRDAPTDAYDAVDTAFQGLTVAQVTDADRLTEVAITLPPELLRDPESLGAVLVRSATTAVPLSQIATLRLVDARTSINHEGGQRRQVVTVRPTRADVSGFVRDAKARVASGVTLPPGFSLQFAGVAEGQAAAARQILTKVAAASIGVVALLVLAFGGGRPAGLILAGTPFALAGGIAAVALTGGILSLGALVGFVTLFGIAARNAILLISHVDHLVEQEGEPWGLETVLRATRERVTPILMTALVTGLGLAPLALEAGHAGREVQGPMAAVILGGLATSTLMSLLLLPALVLAYRYPSSAEPRPFAHAPAADRG